MKFPVCAKAGQIQGAARRCFGTRPPDPPLLITNDIPTKSLQPSSSMSMQSSWCGGCVRYRPCSAPIQEHRKSSTLTLWTADRPLITRRSEVQILPPPPSEPVQRVVTVTLQRGVAAFYRVFHRGNRGTVRAQLLAQRRRSIEQSGKSSRSLCLHARQHVLVGRHREARRRMAQSLALDLDRHPGLEEQRGVRVAKVMKPDPRQSRLADGCAPACPRPIRARVCHI